MKMIEDKIKTTLTNFGKKDIDIQYVEKEINKLTHIRNITQFYFTPKQVVIVCNNDGEEQTEVILLPST